MTTTTTTFSPTVLAIVVCPQCDKLLARDLAGSVVLYCRRCKTEVSVSYSYRK